MTVACTPTVTFLNHSSVLVSDGSSRIQCGDHYANNVGRHFRAGGPAA
jgi:hypothetical protein